MKEAIVSAGPKVAIKDSAIPEPGPDDVIIKVVVSGSNPKVVLLECRSDIY
jgi:NADPH2:quinone reductase